MSFNDPIYYYKSAVASKEDALSIKGRISSKEDAVALKGLKVSPYAGQPQQEIDVAPYDMCSDGTSLYIAGRKGYTGPVNHVCKAVKVSIAGFIKSDEVEYDHEVSTTQEYYWAVKYDAGYLYFAGIGLVAGRQVAIVHKRPVSDLSTLNWSYIYDANPQAAQFRDLEIDGDYVYAIGDSPINIKVLKVKLNKSDGMAVWENNVDTAVAFGITELADYIYIFKNRAGLLYLERVLKTDPTSITETSYALSGGLFRGMNDGVSLYCGGIQPSVGDVQCYVQKTAIATLVRDWGFNYDGSAPGYEYFSKAIKHTDGVVYACGSIASPTVPADPGYPAANVVLEKINAVTGASILHKEFAGSMSNYNSSMVIIGSYIYLACYNFTAHPAAAWVEKRNCSDLELA